MAADFLRYGGSLLAVLFLILVAWRLRLGDGARIADEAEARELADNAVCGFAAVEIALDREGQGALLRDAAGRVLLLAPHGNKFAGRLLDAHATASVEGNRLLVATGERRFARRSLAVPDPEAWCRAIESLD